MPIEQCRGSDGRRAESVSSTEATNRWAVHLPLALPDDYGMESSQPSMSETLANSLDKTVWNLLTTRSRTTALAFDRVCHSPGHWCSFRFARDTLPGTLTQIKTRHALPILCLDIFQADSYDPNAYCRNCLHASIDPDLIPIVLLSRTIVATRPLSATDIRLDNIFA